MVIPIYTADMNLAWIAEIFLLAIGHPWSEGTSTSVSISHHLYNFQVDTYTYLVVKVPDGQGILGFQNGYLLLGANID